MTVFACCDQNRRAMVRGTAFNGVDWLEVLDHDAPTPALRQRVLRVGFVNNPPPAGLAGDNVAISGGVRITGLRAEKVSYDGDVLVVQLNGYGDFSPYLFQLLPTGAAPLDHLDTRLCSIAFRFKVECPTALDCRVDSTCPPPAKTTPPINYLAKDYPTFLQLMLDRMSVTAPAWSERSEADIGMTLVEVLAYVADHLSYQQDAIATEAYLGTARRRTSLRRHARLVDYSMHDGCNSRVWAAIQAKPGVAGALLPGPNAESFPPEPGTLLLTRVQNDTLVDAAALDDALRAAPVCFETLHDLKLYESLNQLHFYVWGDGRCSLPIGATQADFVAPPNMPDVTGRVVLFQEMVSPTTGVAGDADPTHRQAVRIVAQDPPAGAAPKKDPLTGASVVTLSWGAADALTFPLCVSSVTDADHGAQKLDTVSIAWGNVVLADHGLSQPIEDLGSAPVSNLRAIGAQAAGCCAPLSLTPIPARFHPALAHGPLTQQGQVVVTSRDALGEPKLTTAPFDPSAAASAAMQWDISQAKPAIALESNGPSGAQGWASARDLLESGETDTDFVVEIDSDLIARLRFGDGEYGLRPEPGDRFQAAYRVGNGVAGNIGAGALAHVVAAKNGLVWSAVKNVSNPLPAQGGVDMETADSVRQAAPSAFLVQERAVTEDDYVAVSLRNPQILRAAAEFRWTGSWNTVFDTIDRPGAAPVDDAFMPTVDDWLERFRVIGHDLQINGPAYVPLRINLAVCVDQAFFRSDIERALRRLFGTGVNPDGSPAFFNPDNRTFGETLYLSELYALAQSVAGVRSVEILRFERMYRPSADGLKNWKLVFGPTEMARCDNDPNNPERGVLNLILRGGQ